MSLPRMLRGAGYRTALFGKWHLGYDDRFSPIVHGFDEFFGILAADIDYYGHNEATGEPGLYEGTKVVDKRGYMTDLIAERASSSLTRMPRSRSFSRSPSTPALPVSAAGKARG